MRRPYTHTRKTGASKQNEKRKALQGFYRGAQKLFLSSHFHYHFFLHVCVCVCVEYMYVLLSFARLIAAPVLLFLLPSLCANPVCNRFAGTGALFRSSRHQLFSVFARAAASGGSGGTDSRYWGGYPPEGRNYLLYFISRSQVSVGVCVCECVGSLLRCELLGAMCAHLNRFCTNRQGGGIDGKANIRLPVSGVYQQHQYQI